MFNTIVVGTDGSTTARRAVEVAADLAARYGATLHLVCAYRAGTPAVAMMAGVVPTVPLAEVTDVIEGMLEEAAGELRGRGVQVETHACDGTPADVIVSTAEAHHADLVVVGNQGMSGARRILGSVPNTVSHHAHCHVMIVQTS